MGSPRRLRARLLLSLCAILLTLIAAEVGLRVWWPVPAPILITNRGMWNFRFPEVFVADDELFWGLQPNLDVTHIPIADVTNAQGFRNRSDFAPKAAGTQRILCVGDSCTYCPGVPIDETWPVLLGAGEGREVINVGVPGYTSFQGAALLDGPCRDLEPDVLIVEFGHNDATTWAFEHEGTMFGLSDGDRAKLTASQRSPGSLELVRLFRSALLPEPTDISGLSVAVSLPRVGREELAAHLRAFARVAPRTVYLVWPRREQLIPGHRTEFPIERFEAYQALIREMAGEGHDVLDVGDLFLKSGVPVRSLFIDDIHPTRPACRMVADALRERLKP